MDALDFDSQDYGPLVVALVDGERVPELGPGEPNEAVRAQLVALSTERLFVGREIADPAAADCCLAGLWLWHDFLDESHRISQEIDSLEGSYWHAIMHRGEPDYANAKYWFRRVPQHPIYGPLAEAAGELAPGGTWDPYRFVDLCESIARGQLHDAQFARIVAAFEWMLLFDHCFRQATGEL